MRLQVRKAQRGQAKPLIGLYAESGCGKTLSALLLARGFAGPDGKIIMIETESGRGEVFADAIPGGYDTIPIRDEFSPAIYGEAITLAEREKADVLVIDSASHEWEGVGGVCDMAARNEAAGKLAMMVWQKPKMDHAKLFMLRLLQTPISLVIVCMRAKYPMQEVFKNGKKKWERSTELSPKQDENILYEMFLHGWIDKEHKFHGTKYTRNELKSVMPSGEIITIETGKALAEWAKGHYDGAPAAKPANSPSTDLKVILDFIGRAKSVDTLTTVIEACGKLADTEKQIARTAYASRKREIEETEEPPHDAETREVVDGE